MSTLVEESVAQQTTSIKDGFWNVIVRPPIYLHLIFEISSSWNWFLNLIFCLFQTGFLQATQAVKIKFEKDKIKFKNQVRQSISRTRYFKNQVQIDRGKVNQMTITFRNLYKIVCLCCTVVNMCIQQKHVWFEKHCRLYFRAVKWLVEKVCFWV